MRGIQKRSLPSADDCTDLPAWQRPFIPRRVGARVRSQRQRTWSGVSAHITELEFTGPYRAELCHDCSRLSVMLDLVGKNPELRSSRSRPSPSNDNTIHTMNFAPAHVPMWAESDNTRYMRHISFTFEDEAVTSLLDEAIDPAAFVPRLLFSDARLLHLAKLFEIECQAEEPTDMLYGDSLSMALLLRLAALDRPQRPPPIRGGLPAHRLRLMTEYLIEHLADNISLRELADIAHLSRSHFSSAFRISTGMPPHRWLLQARIDKAKELLLTGNLPIAEIASLTGFADQAHITKAFKRVVGVSPGVWRRQRRQ
ncbi:AraC family transcriptional regulator [Inquilinus limosus]|uniref:helix-turn-helix domain-containing protein n=1 Tax=Inquilinus limosus TaxID=171674 RepID=UPI003F15E9C7